MNIEQLAREAGVRTSDFHYHPTTADLTRFAALVRVQALEDAARHFDGRDAGAGGYYLPEEPAQIIRALQK